MTVTPKRVTAIALPESKTAIEVLSRPAATAILRAHQ